MPKQKLISREEVFKGLGGRAVKQATIVLTLIENRTAHLVAQAHGVANTALAIAAIQTPRHAFLNAIAQSRTTLPPPTIQDLEHFAPHWAILAPENPEIRATVAHLISQKYALPANAIPGIAGALGLDKPTVQPAYHHNLCTPSHAAPTVALALVGFFGAYRNAAALLADLLFNHARCLWLVSVANCPGQMWGHAGVWR